MFLEKLLNCAGVSGYEDEVRSLILERAAGRADRVEVDRLGSVIVWKTGRKHPDRVVMVDAHMDEVGFIVTGIEDNGLLRFEVVGGMDPRVLPASRVLIGRNRVPGVIGSKAIHLLERKDMDRAAPAHEQYIDIGVANKAQAEKLVQPGDPAVFDSPPVRFGDNMLRSRALDDRVGCALLMSALKERYDVTVAAVFSVQEEVGGRGARAAAYRVNPAAALVLEGTTCADMHAVRDHMRVTRVGAGPAVTYMEASTIANPALVRLIIDTAQKEGIPWQFREGNVGGTDAGVIHLSRAGVPSAHITVPCRYIHSASSVMSLSDFEAARALLPAVLRRMNEFF